MDIYDILIIGGGCAGLTAAVYGARAGKRVLVVEGESIGGQISTSPKVENYPGFSEISGMEFSDRLYEQTQNLGVPLEFDTVRQVELLPDTTVLLKGEYGEYRGRNLIIAAGARHRHLGLEREEELAGKGVSYCAICDGAFYRGKNVAVVGGGSSALQSAELLCGYCNQVYLIHRRDTFRGEEKLVQRLSQKENLEFVLNANVTKLLGGDRLEGILTAEKESGAERRLDVSGLFIAVGQVPQNEIYREIADLDEAGYLIAGEDCRTRTPNVFAAGDCRTKAVRQLTTAAADGSVAALAAVSR